jgi:hypothetical protein
VLAVPFFILRASLDYAKAGFNGVKRRASELAWGTNSTFHAQFRDRALVRLGVSEELRGISGDPSCGSGGRPVPSL